MCHLTTTNQTDLEDMSVDNIVLQAKDVLNVFDDRKETAKIVHFSFMARGEPLASSVIQAQGTELMQRLAAEATKRNLFPRIMFSTIMPRTLRGKSLAQMFPVMH